MSLFSRTVNFGVLWTCTCILRYGPLFDVVIHSNKIKLVHNGRYNQKLLQLLYWLEMLWFGRLYLVTKVLRNFSWIYHIYATMQCFKLWESAIMDQFVMFRKRVYRFPCDCVLNDGQKKPHAKVATINMKPKHWFPCFLHPLKSTETNETFLTGGSNKNQI